MGKRHPRRHPGMKEIVADVAIAAFWFAVDDLSERFDVAVMRYPVRSEEGPPLRMANSRREHRAEVRRRLTSFEEEFGVPLVDFRKVEDASAFVEGAVKLGLYDAAEGRIASEEDDAEADRRFRRIEREEEDRRFAEIRAQVYRGGDWRKPAPAAPVAPVSRISPGALAHALSTVLVRRPVKAPPPRQAPTSWKVPRRVVLAPEIAEELGVEDRTCSRSSSGSWSIAAKGPFPREIGPPPLPNLRILVSMYRKEMANASPKP